MFAERALSFSIQLGSGSFGGSGFNTVDIPQGLWASATIQKTGSPAYNHAVIQIAGLPLDLMNQLSRIGLQAADYRNNIITVKAGNLGDTLSTVFVGGIMEAFIDFSRPSEAVFSMAANTGTLAAMKPAKPSSYTGSTDVVTIMQSLATEMGYQLENNGVTGKLDTPYFAGSARDQALSVAEAAKIFVYFDNDGGIMAICPTDGSRNTFAPTISPETGMGEYPAYIGPGSVGLWTEYNPNLQVLGNVVVENSIVDGANGRWRVTSLQHELSTRPGGPWFSRIRANNIPQTTGGPSPAASSRAAAP